jgi:hypothetical protein
MSSSAPQIIGFDFGHAETALTVIKDAKSAEVDSLDLPSGRRRPVMVTAVALCKDGVRIGSRAIDTETETRSVGFKSPHLHLPSYGDPTRSFIAAVRDEVRDEGYLSEERPTTWVFGVPSGWDSIAVEAFRELVESLELGDIEVIRESRAAMLHARDYGDFTLDAADFRRTVLVIDLGSSTTDFTIVEGLTVKPEDPSIGAKLGAGLIDKALLQWTLAHHPQAQDILFWLNQNRAEWARLELVCRWAKEDYFTNEAAARDGDPVFGGYLYKPVGGNGTVMFQVVVTKETMSELLGQPMVDGNSWAEQFRQDLRAAVPAGFQPDIVLMTGGASRMPFARSIVRDTFGAERVVVGTEPELAISRGLAIAGRFGYRAAGFRADVDELIASGRVETLVRDRLGLLASAIGEVVADRFYERFVLPAFARFKSGEIMTLDDLETEIGAAVRAELTDTNPAMVNAVATWMRQVSRDLNRITEPICDRWRIPRSALSLSGVSVSDDSVTPVSVSEHLAGTAAGVAAAIAAIVTYVVTIILAALLAGGPITEIIGVVIVVVASIAAAVKGHEATMSAMKTARLPVWARPLLSEKKLRASAPEREAQLSKDTAKAITDNADNITADIARQLDTALRKQAEAAELLIS